MKKQYNTEEALGVSPETVGTQQPQGMDALQAEAQGGKDLPPKMKKELDGYKTLLNKLMHSKETRKQTMEMLKGPPQVSVPGAALTIQGQATKIMEQKGISVSQDILLMGSIFLIGDLIDLGNASGKWENPVDEEETKLIYQDTLQDYIEKGLADGTIDPIQLQQQTEPLMNQNQKEVGGAFAQRGNVPMDVTQEQMLGNQRGMMQIQQTKGALRG